MSHASEPDSRTAGRWRPSPVYHVDPSSEGELPASAPVCPRCHGAGYVRKDVPVGHRDFGRAVRCGCLDAEHDQQQQQRLWRLSNLGAFEEMTFAAFNPRVPGTRAAWQAATQYAAEPTGWLVLQGPCGSVKTHLAAAIAQQQFQAGTRVQFILVATLLDHLRATFAPTSKVGFDDLFAQSCDADLLVLDDLGAERTTAWVQEKLFQLLNHRYSYRLPTIITTNLTTFTELDDRVRSRLGDVRLVTQAQLTAGDYRARPLHVVQQEAS
jgi:DNA replication protein DnaC